jgi:hypothetical protein
MLFGSFLASPIKKQYFLSKFLNYNLFEKYLNFANFVHIVYKACRALLYFSKYAYKKRDEKLLRVNRTSTLKLGKTCSPLMKNNLLNSVKFQYLVTLSMCFFQFSDIIVWTKSAKLTYINIALFI